MSDFKDNVKVAIRIRPFNEKELSENPSNCLTVLESKSIILDSKPEPRTFTYDNVANEKSTQEQLFEIVGMPITTSCIRGYNGTIFAYGQTGAGKTFTIQGAGYDEFSSNTKHSYHLRGILPRCFEYLFANIGKEVSNKKSEYLVKCSYLEIYQENINDLLDPAPRNLQLREDMKKGVYVEGLIEETVKSAMETYELLNIGTQNRHVSFTSMNKESSRSHSVFTLIIESKNNIDGLVNFKTSRFHLIDLAGSERQRATDCAGERLKEAGMINKSLSALGNVINSLVDISEGKSRHVHYRDSKLTFLLKDSLGGNSKTFIIANVSPAVSSFSETLSTLKFAQRAKMIKNAAVVNEDVTGTVNLLKYEIKKLKDELLIQKSLAGEASTFCSRCSSTLSKNFELLNLLEIVKDLEFLLEKNTKLRVSAEKQLKIELNEKNEETKALKVALSKVESKANHDKMVLKFRDATIAKLQVGVESVDIENLKKENISLKEQVENNPLAAQLFVENRKLKAENEQLKKECKVDSESWNGRIQEGHDYTEQLSETLRIIAEEKKKIIEWVKKLDTDNESLKTMLEKTKKQYDEKVKILESENNGLVNKVRSLMNNKSQRDYFGDEENLLKSAEIIQDFFTDSENSSIIQNYQKEIEFLKIKLAEKGEDTHKASEDIEEKFRKVQEELEFYIESTENKDNQLKQSLQEIENLTEACEFLKSNNETLSKNLVEKEEEQIELTQTINRLEKQLTELINSVDGSQEIISNCENLTKKVEELEKERKQLEKKLKSLTKENKNLEILYENTLSQENAEKKNVSMLYEKLSVTLNELQELKEINQELTEKLEILEEEKGKLTENCVGLDELNDKIRGLQVEKEGFLEKLRENEGLVKELEELRVSLDERNGSFEELYVKLEELMAEKMVVVGKFNEVMRAEEGLKDQNERFAAQIEQLEKNSKNLRKENESFRIESENLKNQLEEILQNKDFEVNSKEIKINELENALIMYENSQNSQEGIIKDLENKVKVLRSELKSKKKQVSGLAAQHNSELNFSNEKFLELGSKLEILQETHSRVFEKLNREKEKKQEVSLKAETYLKELKSSEILLKKIKDNQLELEKALETNKNELNKEQKLRNEFEKTFNELKNEKNDLQVLVMNNSEVIQSLHSKILEQQEVLKAEIDSKNEKNLILIEKVKEIKVLEEKIVNLAEEKDNICAEKELVLAENERISKLSQQNEESVKDLKKCLEDERACIEENIVLRLNTEEKLQELQRESKSLQETLENKEILLESAKDMNNLLEQNLENYKESELIFKKALKSLKVLEENEIEEMNLNGLSNRLEDLMEKNELVAGDLDSEEVKENIIKKSQVINTICETLDISLGEVHLIPQKIESITAKNLDLQTSISILTDSLQKESKRTELLSKESEVLKQKITRSFTESSKESQSLKDEISSLNSKLSESSSLAQKLQALESSLSTLSTELSTLNSQNESLSQENNTLKSNLSDLSSQKSTLESEVLKSKEEIEVLKEENKNKMEILKNTNKNILSTRNEINMWKKCIDDKNVLIQELRDELRKKEEELVEGSSEGKRKNKGRKESFEEAEPEIRHLNQVIQIKDKELRELKEKGQEYYAQADEALESQRKEIEIFTKRITSLQGESKRLKEELKLSLKDRESMLEEIKRLKSDEFRNHKEKEDAKRIINQLREEKTKILIELTKDNELGSMPKNVERIKQENLVLKAQVEKMNQDLAGILENREFKEKFRDFGEKNLKVEIEKQAEEVRRLTKSLSRLTDFIFGLPGVSIHPDETSIVDGAIKVVKGLAEQVGEGDREKPGGQKFKSQLAQYYALINRKQG